MANEQNLLRGNPETQFKRGREQSEIAKKGGIASGIAYRQRKTMAEIARGLASGTVTNENAKRQLAQLGMDEEDMTNNAMVVAGVMKAAAKGNVQAIDKWQELTEAVSAEDKPYKLPAEVIGKAFVDINRRMVPNKTYVFKGGRGGLKSSYISLKIIELLKNNPMMHACVVRKVASTLKDSVYAQIKWAINTLELDEEFTFKTNPLEITYKKTGQKIFFRGCDDPIKLKSIKAEFGYIGILWKEEKDQIAGPAEERSINQSVLRGGDLSYDFSSYNPPKSINNWVNKEELIPNENRVIHSCTYLDAPEEWLGQKFIDDAEHLKEVNPEAYEHEYMGVPNGTGGAVFENLELKEISDQQIAQFDTIYQGVDWGWYPDIFAFVRLYYDSDKETIYIFAEHTNNKTTNAKNAEWITEQGYDDYQIVCDSAEKKSVNDFKDLGLPAVPAKKGPGSIEYSFKWLQGRKIVIDYVRCPKAAEEFREYEYERDKDDNVISGYPDKNNHTIDAVRYALEKFWMRRGNQA